MEPSRHVTLSSSRGVVTETEKVKADQYVVRCHKSSSHPGFTLDVGAWIGFRYCNAHWSFVKR
jgi:hypothetical protein